MKKLALTSVLLTLTLVFSSCSVEEDVLPVETSSRALLKDYVVKRDASGAFSVDIQSNKGVSSDNVFDKTSNTNNIYLYSSEVDQKSSFKQELMSDRGELRIGINDTESGENPEIQILDKDFSSKNSNDLHLTEYSISPNEDGYTFDLEFSVKDNIAVSYEYNTDTDEYEIHLMEGNAAQSDFLHSFTKEDGEDLKIVFVNHYDNRSTRSEGGEEEDETSEKDRIPNIIVGG